MGRRSVCDPFDAAAIVERITAGETTAGDAYRRVGRAALRSCDVRPKAEPRKNESQGAVPAPRRDAIHRSSAGSGSKSAGYGRPRPCHRPERGLARARRGARRGARVGQGSRSPQDRRRRRKTVAILFDAYGEFLTGEAIRWCARYAIPLILPNGPGRAILFYESALEADGAGEGVNGKHAARILDVGPSLVRAQALADPVPVARAIVSAKLKASAESVPAIDKRLWSLRLDEARSVAEIVTIEARIAAAYWRAFRDLGLRERKGGDLPRSWLRFANRQKGAQFLGSKHASHPINAMLNYAYVVEAGRLARALTAAGFALPIGFLHSDKHGRNSLVWDAIEPLRPLIDARVFKFIASREFGRSDFPQAGRNAHRLDRAIIPELLRVSLLPWERHEGAARWMERTISDAVKQRLRD